MSWTLCFKNVCNQAFYQMWPNEGSLKCEHQNIMGKEAKRYCFHWHLRDLMRWAATYSCLCLMPAGFWHQQKPYGKAVMWCPDNAFAWNSKTYLCLLWTWPDLEYRWHTCRASYWPLQWDKANHWATCQYVTTWEFTKASKYSMSWSRLQAQENTAALQSIHRAQIHHTESSCNYLH